ELDPARTRAETAPPKTPGPARPPSPWAPARPRALAAPVRVGPCPAPPRDGSARRSARGSRLLDDRAIGAGGRRAGDRLELGVVDRAEADAVARAQQDGIAGGGIVQRHRRPAQHPEPAGALSRGEAALQR